MHANMHTGPVQQSFRLPIPPWDCTKCDKALPGWRGLGRLLITCIPGWILCYKYPHVTSALPPHSVCCSIPLLRPGSPILLGPMILFTSHRKVALSANCAEPAATIWVLPACHT